AVVAGGAVAVVAGGAATGAVVGGRTVVSGAVFDGRVVGGTVVSGTVVGGAGVGGAVVGGAGVGGSVVGGSVVGGSRVGGVVVGVVPVPESGTECGLPGALSAIDRVALRVPAAAGVNVTDTVHVPEGASVAPVHVSPDFGKSPALVPEMVTPLMSRGAVPVF